LFRLKSRQILLDLEKLKDSHFFGRKKQYLQVIEVEGGGKTCAPVVTRRKDIGRMTVRPISFLREKRDRRDPAGNELCICTIRLRRS